MVETLDLEFLGRTGAIACGLVRGPRGVVLVDPGPATTLGALRAALERHGHGPDEIEAVLVTHVHLDHSGGVGLLVRANPRIQVYVHERGAPHVIDPSKLVSSATRLYGDRMAALWGEIVPVPATGVHALRGGEVLDVAGLEVRVAYTPGHASHHVSYLDAASGTAFLGDVGGIRVGAPLLVFPPTPPPDIDLDAWTASLALIRGWSPQHVFVTHFGAYDRASEHLADLEERLAESSAAVRSLLEDGSLDDAERESRFVERMVTMFRRRLPDEAWVGRYVSAVPLDHCWHGLARYWRKRLGEA